MIRINLIPEKAGARPAAAPTRVRPDEAVSPLTYLIVLAIVAAIGGYYYFFVYQRVNAKRLEAANAESKVKAITKEIDSLRESAEELRKAESISQSMLDIVYAIDSEDRVLWAEKLNQLSDLIPDSVYIKRITVSEQIAKVETAESKKQRAEWQAKQKTKGKVKKGATPEGAPTPIFYPQITQELKIYGLTYSENEAERIRLINEFHDNLKSGINKDVKVDFLKGFVGQISYGDVAPNIIGGRPVAEFSFTLRTKPTSPRKAVAAGTATGAKAESAEPEKAPRKTGGSKARRDATDVQ
ncbi:MAG: hypothetical protein N3D11_05600 [Candidatus Sumerlaeia bacterium]|nr:hypothetical protein [Candidatus Sumerlaeia bacterium]